MLPCDVMRCRLAALPAGDACRLHPIRAVTPLLAVGAIPLPLLLTLMVQTMQMECAASQRPASPTPSCRRTCRSCSSFPSRRDQPDPHSNKRHGAEQDDADLLLHLKSGLELFSPQTATTFLALFFPLLQICSCLRCVRNMCLC